MFTAIILTAYPEMFPGNLSYSLIGKALKINPYDQPAVELIKNETIKILN